MKATPSKMSLKPYLETVKAYCEGLSREDMVNALLTLAQEVPVQGRGDFLDRIRSFSSGIVSKRKPTGKKTNRVLLERIAALKEEIEERISSIEDGTYWDHADWNDHGYDDEDPQGVTDAQLAELEQLFQETGRLFLEGRLEAARRSYSDLFAVVDSHYEIPRCYSSQSPDLREERARYCRCVYETAEPVGRLEEFLQCMSVETPLNRYRLDLASELFPMLQDVIDAGAGDLDGWDRFLPAWEKKLSLCHTPRGAALQMEAVERMEGMKGLSRLARERKADQPIGYLFWIQRLEGTGDWRGALDASREALGILPMSGFREQAADSLVKAGSELGDAKAVLEGKRERFLTSPREIHLVALLEEATKQGVRSEELDAALTHTWQNKKGWGEEDSLCLKMLLMAGRIDEAFNMAKEEASVGWSSGTAGILFSAILSLLTGNSTKACLIQGLLKEYAGRSFGFCHGKEEDHEKMYREIAKGLGLVGQGRPEFEKYSEWAEKIGHNRVEHIVSGQHRGAYDRAAMVLGALGEYFVASSAAEKAFSLLNEFLRVKFPRHHAFRSEVKRVVGQSTLLKDLRAV